MTKQVRKKYSWKELGSEEEFKQNWQNYIDLQILHKNNVDNLMKYEKEQIKQYENPTSYGDISWLVKF